jgi:hypothetical protein
MNNFFGLLLVLFFLIFQQKDPYYNKQGEPSTYGINEYIKNNQQSIIKEYEYRIDTLYDVYIFTENLAETSETEDLGNFYLPDYIVITNEEKFVAYEFKDLSKFKQKTLSYADRTVKSVIFHELTHVYFNQILISMRNKNMDISSEYGMIRMFPNSSARFGAEFIEEGVCEYVIYYLNECAPFKDVPIPDNETDLLDENNKFNNLYVYSVIFLKDFLDTYGVKKGIEILIGNRPPTYQELLNPRLYFNRIMPKFYNKKIN